MRYMVRLMLTGTLVVMVGYLLDPNQPDTTKEPSWPD